VLYALPIVSCALLNSCRDDVMVVPPTVTETGDSQVVDEYLGMYVLCEGNMGSNKATLDYLDLQTGEYNRNIYPSRNPSTVMELGDVGNDVKIYGSRLWLVINCSNKVEVADAKTAISLGHVDIPNCRFVAFHEGYAYVTSYVGKVGGTSVIGSVYKVDTLSLKVVGQVEVGYQPDELAVVGDRLYVANSGGYNVLQGLDYDNRVSVIDLATFQVERNIEVAPNLFRLRADRHGRLWVASRGDYMNYPPRLYLLQDDVVCDSLDTPVSDMAFRGDSLLFYGAQTNVFTGKITVGYGYIDTASQIVDGKFVDRQYRSIIEDPSVIEMPYGIMVHPQTGDIYVMDATNYVSSGRLFCFDSNGKLKWKTWTGDIPGHAAFLVKN
jgi:hypothetical protein